MPIPHFFRSRLRFLLLVAVLLTVNGSGALAAGLGHGEWEALGAPKIDTFYQRTTRLMGIGRLMTALPNGDLAVADDTSLRIFNGTRWESVGEERLESIVPLPDGSTLLAGSVLSRLTIGADGAYQMTPLADKLAESYGIQTIYGLALARGHIFCLAGTSLLVIAPDGNERFHPLEGWASGIMAVDDEIYFAGGASPLLNKWDWEKSQLVPHDHVLNDSAYEWIEQVLPRKAGGYWMLTQNNRIFGFDGETSWIWPGNATVNELNLQIQSFVEYRPGQLAIGTTAHGIILFQDEGEPLRQISKAEGLDGVRVDSLGIDNQNGLWAAAKRGLFRIDTTFQTLLFDERHGIAEQIDALEVFQGRLYAATDFGLYSPNPEASQLGQIFRKVYSVREIEDLLSSGEHLHLAGAEWVALDADENPNVVRAANTNALWHPSARPDLMFGSDFHGVWIARMVDGVWKLQDHLVPGIDGEVYGFAEAADGTVWGTRGYGKLARITWEDGQPTGEVIDLPGGSQLWVQIAEIDGEIYVNREPCLRWDSATERFVEAPDMVYYYGEPPYGFDQVFGSAATGVHVCANQRRSNTVPRPNTSVVHQLAHLGHSLDNRGTCIVYDERGVAWMGGHFGILRSANPLSDQDQAQRPAKVTEISDIRTGKRFPIPAGVHQTLRIPFAHNSLHVEIAYQNFLASETNEYQIYLEGFDSGWPAWGETAFRDFTNINPGRYLLHLQGRDTGDNLSQPIAIPLLVEKPWYRSAWAYFGFALGLAAILALVIAANARRLNRRNAELRRLVAQRTQEVDAKNRELEAQNRELEHRGDELEQMTESLTATLQQLQVTQNQLLDAARSAGKAEIATNILHNVGNVLNSVNVSLATLGQKVSQSKVPKLAMLAKLVESQKDQLDRFVASDPRGKAIPEYLTQLSKVLGEEMHALTSEVKLMEEEVTHIKNIIAAQQSHGRNVSLIQTFNLRELCQTAVTVLGGGALSDRIEIDNTVDPALTLESDRHRALDIIVNLIANAKDAIGESDTEMGLIEIDARYSAETDEVTLIIRDNGVGIDSDTHGQLFTHGFSTKRNGHGFGLHSSANQAASLGGNLSLNSEGLGRGATATLTLPRKRAAQRAGNEKQKVAPAPSSE